MDKKIATIINYCSNDYPFLEHSLSQVKKFSENIIVVACDHLFNGEKEDLEKMEESFSKFEQVTFVIYPFIPEQIPQRIYKKIKKANLWHSISRSVGLYFLDKKIERVLFLDVDEIVDGDQFNNWLNNKEHLKYDVLKLACYWYFGLASLQAKQWEDAAVLVKRKKIKNKGVLNSTEREAIFTSIRGKKKRHVLGLNNLPMFHHYSWVKTKEQMLKKVSAWGHKKDKNWSQLIEEAFSKENQDIKDLVHGYELIKVNPFVEINFNQKETKTRKNHKIIYLSGKELLQIVKKRSWKDYICCYLERKRFFKKKILQNKNA